jgi:hypothetical protein
MRPLTLVVVLLVLAAGCTTPTQSMAERLTGRRRWLRQRPDRRPGR